MLHCTGCRGNCWATSLYCYHKQLQVRIGSSCIAFKLHKTIAASQTEVLHVWKASTSSVQYTCNAMFLEILKANPAIFVLPPDALGIGRFKPFLLAPLNELCLENSNQQSQKQISRSRKYIITTRKTTQQQL